MFARVLVPFSAFDPDTLHLCVARAYLAADGPLIHPIYSSHSRRHRKMNSSKILSSLFAYKTWTNAAMYKVLLENASGPAADQWRDAIRMMNHMYVIDKIFAAHLTGATHGYTNGNTPETPEIGALQEAVVAMDAWYAGYVLDLTPEQLAETISFTFTDGLQGSMSREEILMHVITHGSYHRGMVGQMIAERGIKAPPDTLTRSLHIAEPGRRTVALPQ